MFIFDILSGRMNAPNLLSALDLNTSRYRTRGSEFLRIGFHCTKYGVHKPMSAAIREFNEVIGQFNFIFTPNQLMNLLKLILKTYPTFPLPQNKLCIPCAVGHGPSYGLTYSVSVMVVSSTHCRDRKYPLHVFYFICVLAIILLAIIWDFF
jgi:hypothetical protein